MHDMAGWSGPRAFSATHTAGAGRGEDRANVMKIPIKIVTMRVRMVILPRI